MTETLRQELSREVEKIIDSTFLSINGELFNQDQYKIFGDYAGKINIGINPKATVAMINPRFQGLDFGLFKVPTIKEVITNHSSLPELLSFCGRLSAYTDDKKCAYVPPETGRAILLPMSTHGIYRDLLLKGTGAVLKFTKGNKLRYETRGFNGVLELSEAERDLIHSDILERAGVLVAPGIGIFNHHLIEKYSNFTAWIGNYLRAFRVQTRISNLFELSPSLCKAAIDDAIKHMKIVFKNVECSTYHDYFITVLKTAAKNVAIMQAIGFTQDSFHFGQITLCGELVDFGVGNFNRPKSQGEVNTMYPWFRYDRQPILMLNMFYKTHALKAEPNPVLLDRNSSAIINQKTLFSAIRSFSPESAIAIEHMKPEKIFWETYKKTYTSFDTQKFQHEVLSSLESTYFSWDIEKAISSYSALHKELIYNSYSKELENLMAHYENQIETWDRRGPSSIHRMILFYKSAQFFNEKLNIDLDLSNFWPSLDPLQYFNNTKEFINPVKDISWKAG